MNNNLIKESANGYSTVGIAECLLSERRIFLTEEVNSETCRILVQQFIYFESQEPGIPITMYINSPGGEVDSGLVVYDTMRMITSPIRTICIGVAASMGSILFLGGDTREVLPHSRIMIHDPAFGNGSIAGKKPHEIQQQADHLSACKRRICKIIAERTKQPYDKISDITKEDTYYNAEEAVEFGLATGICENII